jgi:hypothetical protein
MQVLLHLELIVFRFRLSRLDIRQTPVEPDVTCSWAGVMRRAPITSDDVNRWKAQGLGLGETAAYKPWIDVRCFSSKGRMSRPLGATTGRMHHLFSDNEDHFFLMADYAAAVLDIREQFPLFPKTLRVR